MRYRYLHKKIMFTFAILLLCQIVSFALFTYWNDSKLTYKQVAEANMLTLKEMRNHLEVEIRILDRVSFQLSNEPQLQSALEIRSDKGSEEPFPDLTEQRQFDALFRSVGESWPEIKNLYVYSIYGDVYGKVADEIALPTPKIDKYLQQDVSIEYGNLLGRTQKDGFAAVSYIRVIRNSEGIPLGWLRFDLVLNELSFIQDLKLDRRTFYIFESHGNLLLSSKPEDLDIVMIAKILNVKKETGYFSDSGDIVTYIRTENPGWRTVSIVPKSMLNEGLIEIRIISVTLVIGSFALSFFILMALSYRITRPLRALSNMMRLVEDGNFKVRVQVASNDEIGRLARQLNTMLESIDQLINQNYMGEIKYRDAQFKMLLSQVNPHFLYNTLEIIDVLSIKGKKEEVSAIIFSLSAMFRYVLKSNRIVTLQDEVINVKSYLNIQMIRFSENLDIKIRMSEEGMHYRVPIFILQPLLENSFKHGLLQKKKKSRILIYTENDGQHYRIQIVDNGYGMSQEQLKAQQRMIDKMESSSQSEGEKIGLQNVHERVRLTFGSPFGLRIDSLEGSWFKVTILLPVTEEGEEYGLPSSDFGR